MIKKYKKIVIIMIVILTIIFGCGKKILDEYEVKRDVVLDDINFDGYKANITRENIVIKINKKEIYKNKIDYKGSTEKGKLYNVTGGDTKKRVIENVCVKNENKKVEVSIQVGDNKPITHEIDYDEVKDFFKSEIHIKLKIGKLNNVMPIIDQNGVIDDFQLTVS